MKLFCIVIALSFFVSAAAAQTFTSLVTFNGPNGEFPSSMVQGTDGTLWGTTRGLYSPNCGNLFDLTTTGTFNVAFQFNCTESSGAGGLTLGTDGNLYGTTEDGGTASAGTIFKFMPSGRTLITLFNFTGDAGGSYPVGGLIQASDGNFYGATYGGGSSAGYGTLFRITPSGMLTTLHTFDSTHGAQPYAGLIQGNDRSFYGTTYAGGTYGGGTIFKLTPQGTFTVLYNLGGSSDGYHPVAGLIQGNDGNFYGTTQDGGLNTYGTVFKITPQGTFTTLHSFVKTDGRTPSCGVIQATDGNFYGATIYGGTNTRDGTIFEMTPSGTVTTLHNFDGNDGDAPCSLVQHTDGTFFGLTLGGGDPNCDSSYGCGTIFSLSVGLGPFVETLPIVGRVGTKVRILGTNLIEATNVTFNGTEATFAVLSDSEIATSVPIGATTGTVSVTTPSATLLSNLPFQVHP